MSLPTPDLLPTRLPETGELVHVRSRRWLVEEVIPSGVPGEAARVRLACADDDNQGQELTVFWEFEPDRSIVEEEGWGDLAARGFDPADRFAAFFNTLRWGCVTATDPDIFQAPFRAGIHIDAYQMEPLRKALRLPRVNLFIADDTGLGKTIEAGLIARELLLRRKAKAVVVAAPASVLDQWKAELEERFGLIFQIVDRAYVARVRQERGFGVNPWRTHSFFLVSHNLLIDPTYADPLRQWLDEVDGGKLLILDEAHHAAPATGNRYGIETKLTRAVRDLSGRFEHRLFLSATPHNGHSNSFSTLLELLDPYRFTRGVPVKGKGDLDEVMVRRLKEDIRALRGGFPERRVIRIEIDGLPADTPELQLSRLLDAYRRQRSTRYAGATKRSQAAAGLLVVGLQQRLLSSTEAFARTLRVHRETVRAQWERAVAAGVGELDEVELRQRLTSPDADDERAELTDAELEAEDAAVIREITAAAEAGVARDAAALASWKEEQRLLDEMERIAESARYQPDAKLRRLMAWIREHQCPGLPEPGRQVNGPPPAWTDRRVIIFTENREGTKRYLREMLGAAVEGTDQGDQRIAVIDGLTRGDERREVQRRFNDDPTIEPLRILIATDAAREGLNFQAHCADLFHFDLPWNPGRIEQRNGRIDRKLQPEPEVRCHYFSLPQRAEDRVLEVLVEKTETIKRQLGSMSRVIEDDMERLLRGGIPHGDAAALVDAIRKAGIDPARAGTIAAEFDAARQQRTEVEAQIERCQTLLDRSRSWVGFDASAFREALSCSLEILGAPGLQPTTDRLGNAAWSFPRLDRVAEADPSWTATLDTLRSPRRRDQPLAEWRREAPVRPIVFSDPNVLTDEVVHLHLDQRVANRLLQRFRSQGFVYHDLSRACLAQVGDAIPRVVLLGRLSLYGRGAERLHEEIVPIAARWVAPDQRTGPLQPYAADAESRTVDLLHRSLVATRDRSISPTVRDRLLATAARDVDDLLPHLEPRAEALADRATKRLRTRGMDESRSLTETLTRQRDRVGERLRQETARGDQLFLGFAEAERRQLEADMQAWRRRLDQFDRDLHTEPERVRSFYEVRARRIEPVGLVYLWPESD